MSRRRNRKKRRFGEGEDLSPMSGLSNLSDAMLVLALGILVALVVHWNVNIVPSQETPSGGSSMVDSSNAVEFSGDDLTEAGADTSGSGEGMERMGTVYYDESTGKYYVVDEQTAAGAETGDSGTEADGAE